MLTAPSLPASLFDRTLAAVTRDAGPAVAESLAAATTPGARAAAAWELAGCHLSAATEALLWELAGRTPRADDAPPTAPVPPRGQSRVLATSYIGGLRTSLSAHGSHTDLDSPPRFVVVSGRLVEAARDWSYQEYPWTAVGEAAARAHFAALTSASATVTA